MSAGDDAFVEILPAPDAPRLAVKDMIAVEGCVQGAGLPVRADRIASADAAVVARFRAAGYAVAGTTHTDAAGFGTMTPWVSNPRHSGRAVGGSSGGSAAAVAAGRAEVGLGTDTGGSVRIPAAYCNLFALKASHGRVPADGILPLSPTLDAPGLLAASADVLADAAPVLMADWQPGAASLPLYFDASAVAAAEPAVFARFNEIAEALGALYDNGTDPPYQDLATAHSTIVCAEGLAVHLEDWTRAPAGFPPTIADALRYAETISAAQVTAARQTVAKARDLLRAHAKGRVLMRPTLPMAPADRHAETAVLGGVSQPVTNANIRLTLSANVAGLPVAVVPFRGLSVQFVGGHGEDEAVLATALAAGLAIQSR
ncbi:amidase family protein [Acuticoccus sp. MNP-M23]|uniref:amidase family protein n=1 Tax=Acuticoccus sp. MNP-M23 TaxID=3072793 RepID=UPI0028160557|nr:amidase family protein [Acuticoccus sp. MNP-M23]WMS43059.1 amidase family protein [Acuticoccus sp. MNP-M23]